MNDFDLDDLSDLADYEAEIAEMNQMTQAELEEFLLDQQAAADIAAERHAERALSFGYGG